MQYITGSNDTLNSIARDVTGTADFAITIAEFNGLKTDVINTPLDVVLEPGLLLQIPDSIVKRGTTIEIAGGAIRQMDWRTLAIGAALALVLARLLR